MPAFALIVWAVFLGICGYGFSFFWMIPLVLILSVILWVLWLEGAAYLGTKYETFLFNRRKGRVYSTSKVIMYNICGFIARILLWLAGGNDYL